MQWKDVAMDDLDQLPVALRVVLGCLFVAAGPVGWFLAKWTRPRRR